MSTARAGRRSRPAIRSPWWRSRRRRPPRPRRPSWPGEAAPAEGSPVLTLETATTGRRARPPEDEGRAWGVDPLALVAVAVLVTLGALNLVAIGDAGLAAH